MRALRYTIYITLYLILLFISGLLNIVVFQELDFSLITSLSFWIEMIVDYTLYISVFIITIMMTYDIYGDTENEYNKIEQDIFEMKDILVTDDFNKDIINRNFIEKKKSWYETLKSAKGNYDRKKTHKIHTEMLTLPKDKWHRKTIKYFRKDEYFNYLLSQDFINNELHYRKKYRFNFKTLFKKIKFKEITVNEVIYGTVTLPTYSSLLVRKPLSRRIFSKVVMIIPSVAFKVVYELLVIDKFKSTAELLKELSFMVIMCLIYALTAVFSAKKAHMDRKSNALTRYGIALEFKNGKRYEPAPIFNINNKKD